MSSMWGIRVLGVRKSMWLAYSAFWQSRGERAGTGPPGLHGWSTAHLASTLGPVEWSNLPCLWVTSQSVNRGWKVLLGWRKRKRGSLFSICYRLW